MLHTISELVVFGIIRYLLNVPIVTVFTLSTSVSNCPNETRINNALNNNITIVFQMSFLASAVALDR